MIQFIVVSSFFLQDYISFIFLLDFFFVVFSFIIVVFLQFIFLFVLLKTRPSTGYHWFSNFNIRKLGSSVMSLLISYLWITFISWNLTLVNLLLILLSCNYFLNIKYYFLDYNLMILLVFIYCHLLFLSHDIFFIGVVLRI
jgi:hypothetical protein